ncbi:MAG: peptidylprolyl isomerase [Planctomycetota bacterium]
MTRRALAPALLLLGLLVPSVLAQEAPKEEKAPAAPEDTKGLAPGVYVELETSKGPMLVELYWEKVPRTVANFVGLIEGTKAWTEASGKRVKRPFYDGLTFHRVIADFMVQGGDPKGDGTGGPGYRFQDETVRGLTHDGEGVLSMANSDRGKTPWSNTGRTNGSQFFITLGAPHHLDGLHTVFGKLVKGQETLRAIGKVPTGEGDKPVEPVVIKRATVVRIGVGRKEVPEPQGEQDPAAQPDPAAAPKDRARVEVICVQYRGCERARAEVGRSRDEAAAIAQRIAGHARLKGADFSALVERWSDLPAREFNLERAQNDPSFEPLFKLESGQVSAPFTTPYGVFVARAK